MARKLLLFNMNPCLQIITKDEKNLLRNITLKTIDSIVSPLHSVVRTGPYSAVSSLSLKSLVNLSNQ